MSLPGSCPSLVCSLLSITSILAYLTAVGFVLFASVYSQIEDVWDWYHVVNFTFHQVSPNSFLLLISFFSEGIILVISSADPCGHRDHGYLY